MNDDMRKLIDETQRLDREATPGPWNPCGVTGCSCGLVWSGDGSHTIANCGDEEEGVAAHTPDAVLISNYRTAAPALAAEVERLDARLAEVERERDEALLTLAAEQGRQEGAPSKRWHYVGNEDGFDEERGEWRRRDGAVKVWWDNGRWIWGRRAQPGVYVAERGQPDDQPARVAMLAADAATG